VESRLVLRAGAAPGLQPVLIFSANLEHFLPYIPT
jgi:hypothetical protein